MGRIQSKFTSIKKWFSQLSWKKRIVIVVLALLLIFAVVQVLKPKKSQYSIVKAEKSDITEMVSETGVVTATGQTDIYSPTNGILESVSVKNGETVTKGQELFKVISSATEQERQDALSSLLQAQSTLGTAKATMYSLQSAKDGAWDTYFELATNSKYQNSDGSPNTSNRALPEFATAQADWLAAEAQYKNQQSVVNQAGSALGGANLRYAATQNATVKAQIEGTVSNLSAENGDTVSAKSATGATTPVLTLANFSTTQVLVSLGEADIPKISEGQKVTFTVSADPDHVFRGVVRRVDAIAREKDGVMKYSVYIEVTNPNSNLRPGMTADTSIITKTIHNTLAVPNAAVKPYQGGRAVRVAGKNGKIEYIPVKIGVRGDSDTQILSGIKEGQEVITSLSNEALKRPALLGN